MITQSTFKQHGWRLVLSGILAISTSLYSNVNTHLSRIDLVEALAPLIPVNQSLVEDHAERYTDIGHLSSQQRLALNGYLMQVSAHDLPKTTLFSPDMMATRAQAAVMIHRMVSAANPKWRSAITESKPVLDANTVAWAEQSITDLVNAEIIQPIGQGYVFPKRSIDAKTAAQWVASANVFIPKPVPIAARIPKQPTESLVEVPTPSVSAEARTSKRNYQWQIRAYGGLSLGKGPYQSNHPPAEVVEETYDDVSGPARRDHGSIKDKRVYGIEGGVELSRRRVGKSLWLVTNYGHHIVSEASPATVIRVPMVYRWTPSFGTSAILHIDGNETHRTVNLPEAAVKQTAHTIRVGLRGAVYSKITPVATINGYLGGGLAISASTVSGIAIEMPHQNIVDRATTTAALDPNDIASLKNDSVIPEKIHRFRYTQNQVSLYGDLGIMATRKAVHVGIQARFQENPGALSVDEKGQKRLVKERTVTGTIFSGITF